mmetsp:Transcript_59963/g.112906  ORF Transcript_59963/g.112906 Transcript_59963/m.112906 type:complete len:296 (+) Transcript_59963:3-890(+)
MVMIMMMHLKGSCPGQTKSNTNHCSFLLFGGRIVATILCRLAHHGSIRSTLRKQHLGWPVLGNSAVIHDNYVVRVCQRLHAMRNDENCSTHVLRHGSHCRLHLGICGEVHVCEGFIHAEDAAPLQECARQAQQLPLSDAEVRALVSNDEIQTLSADNICHLHTSESLVNFVISVLAERIQVQAQVPRKEARLLGHPRDAASQLRQGQARCVHSINSDRATSAVSEPGQGHEDGALAAAGAATYANFDASRASKIDALQYFRKVLTVPHLQPRESHGSFLWKSSWRLCASEIRLAR